MRRPRYSSRLSPRSSRLITPSGPAVASATAHSGAYAATGASPPMAIGIAPAAITSATFCRANSIDPDGSAGSTMTSP